MKIGVMKIRRMIASVEPVNVKRVASCPLPLSRNLWPGIIDRAVSSSGAPRYIEGIKSTKVWVIAIDVMKMISANGERKVSSIGEAERRIIAIKFVCIPGRRPVIVPARIPVRRVRISVNMLFIALNYFICNNLGFVFVSFLSAVD